MNDDPTSQGLIDDLAEEYAQRLRGGEQPSIEEYVERYPQWSAEIRNVFPAVALMENLKPAPHAATIHDSPEAVPSIARYTAPPHIPGYEILGILARGGMGVVYKARQLGLNRLAALKMILGSGLTDDDALQRFRTEAEAVAKLRHPNIVQVYEFGEREGQPFFSLEYVDGGSLHDQIGGKPQDPRAAAALVETLARAMQAAHDQGIIHRDLKPGNILLSLPAGRQGDTEMRRQAEEGRVEPGSFGNPKITDFGLARLMYTDQGLTKSGVIVGTPSYMAPEQASGKGDAVGPATDIYALGAILYEMLTGRAPFLAATPLDTVLQVIHERPVSPRRLLPKIPHDLETICLKCLHKSPKARYATAVNLADDLRRFREGRPIHARRASAWEQAWRWCQRNPALAATTAAMVLLMAAITSVSIIAYATTAQANRKTAIANQEMERALNAEKTQREQAEKASLLALDALNRIYDRFAPTRLVATPPTAGDLGTELPLQRALPPEAVSLLEELLHTYEEIARLGKRFTSLQPQAAEANYRIGSIRQRLGRFDEAVTAYREALALYEQLPWDGVETAVRLKVARTCNDLGWTLRALQQLDEADRLYERAIQILTEAPQDLSKRPEYRYELARAQLLFGQREQYVAPRGLGHRPPGPPEDGPPPDHGEPSPPPPDSPPGTEPPPPGEHPVRRAADLLEQLVLEYPSVPEYRHLLACCYRDLPPQRPGPGQPPAPPNDRAIGLLRKLVADYPQVPDYQLDLCETLARVGRPPRGGERDGPPPSRNRGRLEEAVQVAAKLAKDYPSVPDYTAAHARYLHLLAEATMGQGKQTEGEALFRKALDLQQPLVKQFPQVASYTFGLSVTERSFGKLFIDQQEWANSRKFLENAITRLETLRKKDPRLREVRPFLSMAYHDLAFVLQKTGEPALAEEAMRKAEEFRPPYGPDSRRPPRRGQDGPP